MSARAEVLRRRDLRAPALADKARTEMAERNFELKTT